MRHSSLSLACILIFLLQICAPAYAYSGSAHYVTTADVPPQLLDAPPTEGTTEWKDNIQAVLSAQSHVNEVDIKMMRDEQKIRISLVTDVLGADFTREKFPHTFELMDRVFDDSGRIVENDKAYWHTRRPYLTDSQVKL